MALLTDEELMETLEKQLPALLARHPEMEQRIYTAFMRTFATKEEVAKVLSELRDFRGEFDTFRLNVNERFVTVDERFVTVDERFDKVDERFDKVDERFDKVDERFDKVDERFEKVDERFDKVDERFEKVDERFDRMDQRFSDLRDWVEMIVGRFQTRSGRKLEDIVAGTMRLVLGRDDIVSENVRLRQPLEDPDGVIGPSGRRYEVDILVDDGTLLMFEVKSACEVEDVDRFADKVALMRTLRPDKSVSGVIVTMAPLNDVETRCREWGIKLVR